MTTSERLANLLEKHYKVPPERLAPDVPLAALGIDSLGMGEMLFIIEHEFSVELPYEPPTLTTFGDAVRYIDGLLAARERQEPGSAGTTAPDIAPDPHL